MSPDDSTDGRRGRDYWTETRRRRLLKAVGGGTALSIFAGIGSAQTAGGDDGEDDRDGSSGRGDGDEGRTRRRRAYCRPCIDKLAGYTLIDGDRPARIRAPAHTVEMRIDDADVLFPEDADGQVDPPSQLDPGEDDPGDSPASEPFPDFYFTPVGLHVEVGEVVAFSNVSDDVHTVTAIHPRFYDLPLHVPEVAPPFSSPPISPGETWFYTFSVTGVYDVVCLPHLSLGMVMRVVVTDGDGDVPEAPSTPEDESLPPPETAVLSASELAPEYIAEQGSVEWTDLGGSVEGFDPDELFAEE